MTDPIARVVADLSPRKRGALAAALRRADPIAIVGVGCRFPGGVRGPDDLWRLLAERRDATGELPPGRWDLDAHYDPRPGTPGKLYARRGGFLDDVDRFDAAFFGIAPREAERLDPQQRLLLEVAWEALEHAGLVPERLAGSQTGVFLGICADDYVTRQLRSGDPAQIDVHALPGNVRSIAAGRVSYVLDLEGPNVALDTACSSSLVAVHLACQSLHAGECDLALAGGVNLILSPENTVYFSTARLLSPDGTCKAFDARADGFARGEGCGVVVLKRLADALADGDAVLAVVRGSAVNHNGASQGLTAPDVLAQRALLRRALDAAGVAAEDVGFVEAHGTGTLLGDAIELDALAAVYGRPRPDGRPCYVGSLKTNLGHMEGAAGVGGLIKTALCLERGEVPANLHFTALNPNTSLDGTALALPTAPRPFPAAGRRFAAVSSFGFGGTNAHVVLEQAPAAPPAAPRAGRSYLLPLSARAPGALRALAGRYRDLLRGAGGKIALHDVCYTASVRRSHHRLRLAAVARTSDELAELLDGFVEESGQPGAVLARPAEASERATLLRALGERYAAGRDVDWRQLYPDGGRCVRLPTYPFQRRRYWYGAASAHALLGEPGLPDEAGAVVWRPRLDAPYLADHRVGGAAVLPGAAYVEMALAAGDDLPNRPGRALASLELLHPLLLAEHGARELGLVATPADGGAVALRWRSRTGDGEWVEHARGMLVADADGERTGSGAAGRSDERAEWAVDARGIAPPSSWLSPDDARARCEREVASDEHYAALARAGLDYGPAFRAVERLWLGRGEAVGLVVRPPALADEPDGDRPHPAVLDACLQVFVAAVLAADPELAPVLAGVGRVRCHDAPASYPLRAHARLGGNGRGDVVVADAVGRPVVELRDLRLGRLDRPAGSRREPLSFGQEALYALHRLAPASPAYNFVFAARIRSRLDVAALREAIGRLVARHPMLGASFGLGPEGPYLELPARPAVDVGVEDGAGWDEPALRARVEAAAAQPFDLERGPPTRARVFARTSDEHVLVLAFHHAVMDAWSITLVVEELGELYAAAVGGAPAPRAPGPAYADFVGWQAQLVAGPRGAELADYWTRRLAGAPTLLALPTDHPHAAGADEGGAHCFRLDAALTARIRELAGAADATPYVVLLAAFQALLGRYTGQIDFLVASPLAGRSRAELARTVGYFINPVALRADLAGDPSFRALVDRVRATVLEALDHGDYPFPLLVKRLQPARDPARAPLVQAMLVYQRPYQLDELVRFFTPGAPPRTLEVGGLALEPFPIVQQEGQLDLVLELAEVDGQLFGTLKYRRHLFEPTTVARMADHFEALLRAAVADPDRPIAALPLATSDGAALAMVGPPAGPEATVVDLFAAQAARTPDAIAVECRGARLTYRELDARSAALAATLRARGVGAEARVAVCLERSAELVVALLAVLRAGGAYLPLDPAYPPERLAFMLRDAAPALLLTEHALHDRLPPAPVPRLEVEDAPIAPAGAPAPPTPGQLAYVVYTSGSTGVPNGVEVPHRALTNVLRSVQRRLGVGEPDVLVALTSVSFDIAAIELFLPLVAGARLVVAGADEIADPVRLAARIDTSGATVVQATPSGWRALVEAGWRGRPGLRVLSGGEPLPRRLADALLGGGVELWNLYGPSETTIWSTAGRVESGADEPALGEPLDGTRLYLLDPAGRPVPPGVEGEIAIGGVGVARGYLGRPELTAERFVPDPFAPEPDARMYRTGDRARRRADGALEFRGRADGQVKVRGVRVEPGEVEAALARHPAVRAAAVVASTGPAADDGARLVAYVVSDGAVPAAAELRRFLLERLPPQMVPAAFVPLDALPLTPGGKVDRGALPPFDPPSASARLDPPADETEAALAGLWAEVLGVAAVGRDDNFFDLGGDSIGALRIAARAEARGLALEPRLLFQHQTVAELAAHVRPAATVRPAVEARPKTNGHPSAADFPLAGLDQPALDRFLTSLGRVGAEDAP